MIAPSNPNPSNAGGNGRDGAGRFGVGNKCGKGNPSLKRVHRLRAEMLKFATPSRHRKVVAKLYQLCLDGDMDAIREWLLRTVGKPVQQAEQVPVDEGEATPMTKTELESVLGSRAAKLISKANGDGHSL